MEADHNLTLRENVQTVAWVQTAQTQSVHAATSSRTLKLRYISNMWGFSDVITLAEEPETDPLNCKTFIFSCRKTDPQKSERKSPRDCYPACSRLVYYCRPNSSTVSLSNARFFRLYAEDCSIPKCDAI